MVAWARVTACRSADCNQIAVRTARGSGSQSTVYFIDLVPAAACGLVRPCSNAPGKRSCTLGQTRRSGPTPLGAPAGAVVLVRRCTTAQGRPRGVLPQRYLLLSR